MPVGSQKECSEEDVESQGQSPDLIPIVVRQNLCLNHLLATGQALLEADSAEHHAAAKTKEGLEATPRQESQHPKEPQSGPASCHQQTASEEDMDSDVEPGAWDKSVTSEKGHGPGP